MNNQNIFYKNINGLRRANVQIPLTDAQMREVIRCKKDYMYFFKNYTKIVDNGKIVPFVPRDYQEGFIKEIHENRFVISMQSRQMGKSVSVCSYVAWFAIFQSNMRCALLANTAKMAKELLKDVKLIIENIPMWMQHGIKEYNKTSIEFENGSTIFCEATTENSLRGDTPNFVLLDEFAHIQTNVADAFIASTYPSISGSEDSKLIIVSTPKGLNHFYKTWIDAEQGNNDYTAYRVDWWQHPKRDDVWRETTIRNIGEQRFAQEFGNDFQGSSGTLISAATLKNMAHIEPLERSGDLKIYHKPEKDREYIITVDVAHGKGLDYTVCSVMDVTEMPFKYCAQYRSNTISPLSVPEIILNLGVTYNNAFVLIELNDLGFGVAESLWDELEYENIFAVKSKGASGQILSYGMVRGTSKGVRMTSSVKKIGCSNIKSLIENKKILIQDEDTIDEFKTFIFKDSARGGTFQADEGKNDDIVMTLVLFGWLVSDKIFSEMSDSSVRKEILDVDIEKIEESLIPVGFFSTNETFGLNDEDANVYSNPDGDASWF